jgi:lipoprotein-anchoring transpeptidase ErfK/SrfK
MSRRTRRPDSTRSATPGRPPVGALLAASIIAASALAAAAVAGPASTPDRHATPEIVAQEMRLEISLSARELYEYRGDERVRTWPVAVGQPGHETPEGSWGIHQVDWNPDWTPPDSDWAADADYTPPGHPRNPMGRVRMIYRAPYSIHGTEELESLGRAASHGSVRMANDDIIELARRVMEAGGASRPDAWFDAVLADPTEMHEVPLPSPVPLTNRP